MLYIAFGEQYQREARRSLASLLKTSKTRPPLLLIICGREEPQPDHFILRESVKSFRSKPLYILEASPFAQTLFLDTDTVVARDPDPVFGLLRHYDSCALQAVHIMNYHRGRLEPTHAVQLGSNLFRKCAK